MILYATALLYTMLSSVLNGKTRRKCIINATEITHTRYYSVRLCLSNPLPGNPTILIILLFMYLKHWTVRSKFEGRIFVKKKKKKNWTEHTLEDWFAHWTLSTVNCLLSGKITFNEVQNPRCCTLWQKWQVERLIIGTCCDVFGDGIGLVIWGTN